MSRALPTITDVGVGKWFALDRMGTDQAAHLIRMAGVVRYSSLLIEFGYIPLNTAIAVQCYSSTPTHTFTIMIWWPE